jgi:hypothetical protein
MVQSTASDSFAEHVTSDASCARRADPATRAYPRTAQYPRISAALAGNLRGDNKTEVERARRPAGKTDLYLAHFLGAGGATEILKAIRHDIDTCRRHSSGGGIGQSVFFDATMARVYGR